MKDTFDKDSPFYTAHMRSMKKFVAISVPLTVIYVCLTNWLLHPYFQTKYGSLLLFPMLFVECFIIGVAYYAALKLTPLTSAEEEIIRADFEKFIAEQNRVKAMSDVDLLAIYDFAGNNSRAAILAELERRGIKSK